MMVVLLLAGCGDKDVTIVGIVQEVNGTDILIDSEGAPYVIHLSDADFAKGVDTSFVNGNEVEISYGGEVAESYPMQIWGKKVLRNEAR